MGLLLLPLLAGCVRDPVPHQILLDLGAILPMGESAVDLRPALDLAVQQVNQVQSGLQVRLHTRDAGDDASTAFGELRDRTAAILDLRTSEGRQPLFDRANAAQRVVIAVGPVSASQSTGTHGYRVATSPAAEAASLATLARQEGADRPAIVHVSDAYGNGVASHLRTILGGSLVQEASYRGGDAGDARRAGAAVCALGPDAVLLLTYGPETVAVLQGMQDAGCREGTAVLGGANAAFVDVQPASPGAELARGLVGVVPQSARWEAFGALYRSVHFTPGAPLAAETYDAVLYVALAAFDAHAGPGTERERGEIVVTPQDVSSRLLGVADPPGTIQTDFAAAAQALRGGDDIDWRGYAAEGAFTQGAPREDVDHVRWSVGEDGRVVRGETVIPR